MLSKMKTNKTESLFLSEEDFKCLKGKYSLSNGLKGQKTSYSSSLNDNNELNTRKITKRTNKGRKENFSLPTDKIKCDICLEYSDYSKEEIISCSRCQGHFHKSCYDQYEIINSSSSNSTPIYKCFRCVQADKLNKNINDKDFNCFICGHSNKILNYNPLNRLYYHMICLLFISELCDLTKEEMSKEKIRRWRYKNSCKYCGEKLSKSVAVIKCKKPKCKDYYHVPCAVVKGMIFSLNFMRKYYNISKNEQIPFYCSNHNKKIVNQYKNYIMKEEEKKETEENKEKNLEKNEEKTFSNFEEQDNKEIFREDNDLELDESLTGMDLDEDEDKKMQESEESENNEEDINNEQEKSIIMDLDDSLNNDVFHLNFGGILKEIYKMEINEGEGFSGLNPENIYGKENNIDEICLNKKNVPFLNRQNSNIFFPFNN